MAVESHGPDLVQVVALLAAGVVAVPVFKRLGLGSVLGYLAAGLAIGPFGLKLLNDPEAILHLAELGVVMFLFIIGLEMQPARLWALRREIFGLGVVQVVVCGALATGLGILLGLPPVVALVAGAGFTLSSTAIVMQLLEERGDVNSVGGQRIMSILLLEDLAIVPLLALVAFLAPVAEETSLAQRFIEIGIALGAVVALVVVGRWLLNPLFRLLAASHAREVMTAAALLVVLGAALAMQLGGLSMAMGAFLAGVLLSESTFRHQLEADIEPFRGILLGLFFMGVGMSLDIGVIARDWPFIALATVAYTCLKALAAYGTARLFRSSHSEALGRGALLAQGGEFAFVLYAAAVSTGIFTQTINARFTAVVIISMAITPILVIAARRLQPAERQSMDGIEVAEGLTGSVLLIGFGRFGQVVSQGLLSRGVDVSIIDADVEMIRTAAKFGFKVYFGDASRLDILHAAGAGTAREILICVDDKGAAELIAEHAKEHFPHAKVFARAFDRVHALKLLALGVDYQIRELVESALVMGQAALEGVGVPRDEAAQITADVKRRDLERLELQRAGDISAGLNLLASNQPVPTPLTKPKQVGKALNAETEQALKGSQ